MSASHCDECRKGNLFWYSYQGSEPFGVMKCEKGHKPRFYKQRNDNPLDMNYGWKRTCGDFQRRGVLTPNAELTGGGANE